MSARSHRPRSCSASGTSSPPGPVRAGRRASVSSISASSPVTSGSAGQAGVQPPGQPDRLAGQVGAGQVGAAAAGVSLVEQQVEDVQHGPEPPRPLVRRRQRERLAGGLQRGLGPADPLGHGRLRHQERGGDLPGGQAADRAQRERDGRARGQRRVAAHEHEDQRVVPARRRPRPAPGPPWRPATTRRPAPPGGGGRPRCGTASVSRRAATRISQPSGLSGVPSAGHRVAAASSASWTASSAAAKSPKRRATAPEGLRRQLAQQALGARGPAHPGPAYPGPAYLAGAHTSGSGALSTWRTSMGWLDRHPARAGRGGGLRGDLDGPRGRLHVDQPVPGQQLLGLRGTARR